MLQIAVLAPLHSREARLSDIACRSTSVVCWGCYCCSNSFIVSNGVHQGSIFSPFLFALYLDGLLASLVQCGVGCEVSHLGHILTFNLCDKRDILRVTKDFNCKSNYLLSYLQLCRPYFSENLSSKIILFVPVWLLFMVTLFH